jgi:hypothetical protein
VEDGEYDDSAGNGIYDWAILPESELSVLWQLNADPGLAETRMFNDELDRQLLNLAEHLHNAATFNAYIYYSFILDGQLYEGYTKGQTIRIEPQPKLFVSYALEKQEGEIYDLIVKATNAGAGTARNVTFGMPSIPGMSEGQIIQVLSSYSDYAGERQGGGSLNLGNIPPGETGAGKFTIMGSGLENIAKLPTITVETKRSASNPNIIAVPLTMQQAFYSDFGELRNEIDRMEENLHKIMERTGSDLGGVVVDAFDFARQQQAIVSWSSMINQTKAFINLISFVNAFKPKTGTLTDFYKDDSSTDYGAPLKTHNNPMEANSQKNLLNKNIYFNKNSVYWDSFKDALESSMKSLLKSAPEKASKILPTIDSLQHMTMDDVALLSYYLTMRKEIIKEIDQLEEEIDKIKGERTSSTNKCIAAARSLAKEESNLLERLNYNSNIDWENEGKDFISYKEAAAYYLEQAGIAFNSADMHTGEQKTVWFNKGKGLFKFCKENQILGESALTNIILKAKEEDKPTLERLRQVYLERNIFSNEPLKLIQAQYERELELEELNNQLTKIEEYLLSKNIYVDIIDLGVPELGKITDVFNALTDLKELTAVFEILPNWAESLGNLASNARLEGYAPDKMGQLLQDYVDEIYALTGGKEIPEETMEEFINELKEIDSDNLRTKRLLTEGIKYMPFYADVSRDSLAGDDGSFLPESTERMVLEIRNEVKEAEKFDIFGMQE